MNKKRMLILLSFCLFIIPIVNASPAWFVVEALSFTGVNTSTINVTQVDFQRWNVSSQSSINTNVNRKNVEQYLLNNANGNVNNFLNVTRFISFDPNDDFRFIQSSRVFGSATGGSLGFTSFSHLGFNNTQNVTVFHTLTAGTGDLGSFCSPTFILTVRENNITGPIIDTASATISTNCAAFQIFFNLIRFSPEPTLFNATNLTGLYLESKAVTGGAGAGVDKSFNMNIIVIHGDDSGMEYISVGGPGLAPTRLSQNVPFNSTDLLGIDARDEFLGTEIINFTATLQNSTFFSQSSSGISSIKRILYSELIGLESVFNLGSTWNSADKHNSLDLSNGDLTFTNTAGALRSGRSINSCSTDICYYKTQIGVDNSSIVVGWANLAASLNNGLGEDTDGIGYNIGIDPGSSIRFGGATVSSVPNLDTGDNILTAYDFNTGTVYFWVQFNNTGDYSLIFNGTQLTTQTLFGMVSAGDNGIGTSDFSQAIDEEFDALLSVFNVTPLNNTPYNLTISSPTYISRTFENFILNESLVAELHQSNIIFNITEAFSNLGINNFTLGTPFGSFNTLDGNLELNGSFGNFTFNITTPNHFGKIFNVTIDDLSENITVINFAQSFWIINVFDNETLLPINNFTATVTSVEQTTQQIILTTTGQVIVPVIIGNFTVTIDTAGFAPSISNIEIDQTFQNFFTNISLAGKNDIDIFFFNEQTRLLMNTTNITAIIIKPNESVTLLVTNGTIELERQLEGEWEIHYSAPGFQPRVFTFTLLDKTDITLNLFLINDSIISDILFRVVDQDAFPLESGIIKALRFFPETNTFELVESSRINFEGEAVLHLVPDTVFYKFIIEFQGNVLKETSPTRIFDNIFFIQVSTTTEGFFDSFFLIDSLQFDLFYQESSDTFILTFNDASNILRTATLKVNKKTPLGDVELFNQQLSTSSGTILFTVTDKTGVYVATALFDTTKEFSVIAKSVEKTFAELFKNFGSIGLFVFVIFFLTVSAVGVFNPVAAVAMSLFALVAGTLMGIAALSYGAVIFALVLGGIIIFKSKT